MAGKSFVDQYGNANPDKRIDIILDYYKKFPSIIEGQKKILVLKIKNDREYIRQHRNEDVGNHFMGNELSDPTACEAIENVYIEDMVFRGNDISELVTDLECEDNILYRRQFYILQKMQEEYMILQAQLPFLNSNEKRIFELCMEDGHDFQSIAEHEGMQVESVRSRVWQIRKKIKKSAANYMEKYL